MVGTPPKMLPTENPLVGNTPPAPGEGEVCGISPGLWGLPSDLVGLCLVFSAARFRTILQKVNVSLDNILKIESNG